MAPDTKEIRDAIALYYDKNRAMAKRGIATSEIVDAVRRKYPRSPLSALRARLNNVKASLIYADVLVPGMHGVWKFTGRCPHQCDLCFKMCRFTGVHYDRHRCLAPHR